MMSRTIRTVLYLYGCRMIVHRCWVVCLRITIRDRSVGNISFIRWWSAGNTAAEIERTFPELGQSVRTSIEFGRMSESELRSAGIEPSLAENLQTHTERRLMRMIEKLSELETTDDVAAWHREAQELLDEIDRNQLGGPAVDHLRELLTANAGGTNPELIARAWNVRNNYCVPPEPYSAATQALAASLQQRIQEIFLGDMESDFGDSPHRVSGG